MGQLTERQCGRCGGVQVLALHYQVAEADTGVQGGLYAQLLPPGAIRTFSVLAGALWCACDLDDLERNALEERVAQAYGEMPVLY